MAIQGKSNEKAPSSVLLASSGNPESTHVFVEDVRQNSDILVYSKKAAKEGEGDIKAKLQDDCLLLAPVPPHAAASPLLNTLALLGIEYPTRGAAQLKEHISLIVELATALGQCAQPLFLRQLMVSVCKQAVQWLRITTGTKNVYISLFDTFKFTPGLPPTEHTVSEQLQEVLEYVACSQGQEFLLHGRLPPGDGVSHTLLSEAPTPEKPHSLVHIKDLKDASTPAGIKFWRPDMKGKEGELLLLGLTFGLPKAASGPDAGVMVPIPVGVLGMDTLGSDKKTAFSAQDEQSLRSCADIMNAIFASLALGKSAVEGMDKPLDIEKLLGPSDILFYKRIFYQVLQQLRCLTKDQILEMAKYNSPPTTIVNVVRATLIVLKHKPKSVKGWAECRPHIKMALVEKMAELDPTTTKTPIAFYRRAKFMLKGLTMQTVFEKGSLPASLMFQWAYVCIQLRYTADTLRRRYKEGTLDVEQPEADMLDATSEISDEVSEKGEDAGEEDVEGGGDEGGKVDDEPLATAEEAEEAVAVDVAAAEEPPVTTSPGEVVPTDEQQQQ